MLPVCFFLVQQGTREYFEHPSRVPHRPSRPAAMRVQSSFPRKASLRPRTIAFHRSSWRHAFVDAAFSTLEFREFADAACTQTQGCTARSHMELYTDALHDTVPGTPTSCEEARGHMPVYWVHGGRFFLPVGTPTFFSSVALSSRSKHRRANHCSLQLPLNVLTFFFLSSKTMSPFSPRASSVSRRPTAQSAGPWLLSFPPARLFSS